MLGGIFWPPPTGDSTLSGTGLTLADAPGLEPPVLPDQADPGVSIDPDAGRPTVLVTPATPQAGPDIEGFDLSDGDPATVFKRSKLRDRMKRAGKLVDSQVAHHIVPGGGPMSSGCDAGRSQRKLEDLGIDRNDVENGIALSPEFHGKIHTSDYYRQMERYPQELTLKENIAYKFHEIGANLQKADRVYHQIGQFLN